MDILQKTAKKAFGSEAQKFIDKTIYAKKPDHVKKILNRAYLEGKPYTDIVLHLEREMCLNGLGAPDETTLVPVNTLNAVVAEDNKEQQQRGYCFLRGKYGHYKEHFRRYRKEQNYATKTTRQIQTSPKHQNINATRAGNYTKLKIVGKEPTRQMIPGKESENLPSQPLKSANSLYQPRPLSQTPKSPRFRFGETVDARAYTIETPPNRYEEYFMTEFNEELTQD